MTTRSFTKEYTREFSLLTGEIFLYSFFKLFKDLPNKKLKIPYIEYRTEGANEYWEDANGLQEFLDALVEKTTNDPAWYEQIISAYKRGSEIVKKYQNTDLIRDTAHFTEIIEEVIAGYAGWLLMYYGPTDERMPANLRLAAQELRALDSLGDDGDELIRRGLSRFFPHLKGLELELSFADLKKESIPNATELSLRRQRCILHPHDLEIDVLAITLEEFASNNPELKFQKDTADNGASEIRGQIAYKGKLTGKAKIVKRRDQIDRVQEGDVLISPMTTPHFLPAMQRAGAIVTDEGGITSHAAILARELKKPCVIGTRFATQIFKDGDMVEVDADNGVVRKI